MPALGQPATEQLVDGCGRPRALLCLPRHRGPDRGVTTRSEIRLMAKRDYYEILGLSRGASEQDIKSAFRALAKDCHPDRNAGDKAAEHKFKELNEAYEALRDPQKRAAYDQFGHAAFDGHAGRGGARLRARLRLLHVGHLRRPVRRVHGRAARPRPALGPRARRRPALQHGDHAAGGLRRQDRADPRADQRHLRGLHRHRRQDRHAAGDLPDLLRCRQGARQPRASSPSSAPARPARGAARSSTIRAAPAAARAG